MSQYGISAIKWNPTWTEIAEVVIHRALGRPEGSPHGWAEGEAMLCTDVADLIALGEKVYVLRPSGPVGFDHVQRVRAKRGQFEYLQSYGTFGQATRSLQELPQYQ